MILFFRKGAEVIKEEVQNELKWKISIIKSVSIVCFWSEFYLNFGWWLKKFSGDIWKTIFSIFSILEKKLLSEFCMSLRLLLFRGLPIQPIYGSFDSLWPQGMNQGPDGRGLLPFKTEKIGANSGLHGWFLGRDIQTSYIKIFLDWMLLGTLPTF